MTPRFIVRDYHKSDFEEIKAIHESTQIDYKFPDINSSLFLVTKVLEWVGVIRQVVGSYIQVEYYLWADKTEWATPEQKLECIKALDKAVTAEVWMKGVDEAVLYLPPGMERFGERLVEDFGFSKARDGWVHFTKRTGAKDEDCN